MLQLIDQDPKVVVEQVPQLAIFVSAEQNKPLACDIAFVTLLTCCIAAKELDKWAQLWPMRPNALTHSALSWQQMEANGFNYYVSNRMLASLPLGELDHRVTKFVTL